MEHAPALRLAFDLVQVPSQVRLARTAPLPRDVLTLLRIAAGDQETTQHAMIASGRSLPAVREAAGFFIEQMLLFPEADSYRVLGATPEATSNELRRNMALLLRWLHPDLDRHGERKVFATRVTRAWNDLKTPERRAAYDQALRRTLADKARLRDRKHARGKRNGSSRGLVPRYGAPRAFGPHVHRHNPPGLLRRLLMSLFGAMP